MRMTTLGQRGILDELAADTREGVIARWSRASTRTATYAGDLGRDRQGRLRASNAARPASAAHRHLSTPRQGGIDRLDRHTGRSKKGCRSRASTAEPVSVVLPARRRRPGRPPSRMEKRRLSTLRRDSLVRRPPARPDRDASRRLFDEARPDGGVKPRTDCPTTKTDVVDPSWRTTTYRERLGWAGERYTVGRRPVRKPPRGTHGAEYEGQLPCGGRGGVNPRGCNEAAARLRRVGPPLRARVSVWDSRTARRRQELARRTYRRGTPARKRSIEVDAPLPTPAGGERNTGRAGRRGKARHRPRKADPLPRRARPEVCQHGIKRAIPVSSEWPIGLACVDRRGCASAAVRRRSTRLRSECRRVRRRSHAAAGRPGQSADHQRPPRPAVRGHLGRPRPVAGRPLRLHARDGRPIRHQKFAAE